MRAELKSRIPRAAACASAALTIAVVACSTPTTQTSTWMSPTYAGGPMRSVVVFGGRVNNTDRRTLEDGFVSMLAEHGVRATSSYMLFPGAPPRNAAEIRATLRSNGYDAALVSTLEGVSEQMLVTPDAGWDDGFTGSYWGTGEPMYAETDRFVKFETTLWSASTGKIVWSAITQTENPKSGQDFVSSLTKNIVPTLAKVGLIPAEGEPAPTGR